MTDDKETYDDLLDGYVRTHEARMLEIEFYTKMEQGVDTIVSDRDGLVAAAVVLRDIYIHGRIRDLGQDPEVGAQSFKGVGDA